MQSFDSWLWKLVATVLGWFLFLPFLGGCGEMTVKDAETQSAVVATWTKALQDTGAEGKLHFESEPLGGYLVNGIEVRGPKLRVEVSVIPSRSDTYDPQGYLPPVTSSTETEDEGAPPGE